VPTAIQTVADLGGGWPATRAHNHALVLELRARLGGTAVAPDDAIGSMAAFPVELPAGMTRTQLEHALLSDGWEVPIVETARGILVRVSAHLYNQASEGDALAAKLHALGVRPRTL
jgi:selenocysteine lyase/cysteine desulfurase